MIRSPEQIGHCISADAMQNSSSIATARGQEFDCALKRLKVILGSSFEYIW